MTDDLSADKIAIVNELLIDVTDLTTGRIRGYGYVRDDHSIPIMCTLFTWLLINALNAAPRPIRLYSMEQAINAIKENVK